MRRRYPQTSALSSLDGCLTDALQGRRAAIIRCSEALVCGGIPSEDVDQSDKLPKCRPMEEGADDDLWACGDAELLFQSRLQATEPFPNERVDAGGLWGIRQDFYHQVRIRAYTEWSLKRSWRRRPDGRS